MKKEVTICKNCIHRLKFYKGSILTEHSWMFVCKLSVDPNWVPVDLVTGQVNETKEYLYCSTVNRGNCKKFSPGENQCRST